MAIAETERLRLREIALADLDAIAAMLADPEVMRFSLNGPKTREASRAYIERCQRGYAEHGVSFWAVDHKRNGALVGICGCLRQEVDGLEEWEIAYRFARAYWSQGLATEAAGAVKRHMTEVGGRTRLISIIEAANHASIRVAEKLGMRLEKETRFHGIPVRIYAWTAPPG